MKKIFTLLFLCVCGGVYAQIGFANHTVVDESFGDINTEYVSIADIDGDGKNDVISKGYSKIVWHKNLDGQGTFGRGNIIHTDEDMLKVITGDIDGDGDPDIIFHTYQAEYPLNKVNIIKNNGNGTFGPVMTTSSSGDYTGNFQDLNIRLADIDADGKQDIVFIKGFDICWLKNINGQDFAPPAIIAQLSPVEMITFICADFTGDGLPDIVYDQGDTLGYVKNNGNGNFAAIQTLDTGLEGYNLAAADADGDGDNDVLFLKQQQSPSGYVRTIVWYKNTNGQFASQQTILPSLNNIQIYNAELFDMQYTDVDGDGMQDAIISTTVSGRLAWYKNMGNLTFGSEQLVNPSLIHIKNFAIGNIDGNSAPDIVAASPGGNRLVWHKNTGAGFAAEKNINTMLRSAQVVAGDIDGDGDLDLVASAGTDYKVVWFKNNGGQGSFNGEQQIVLTSNLVNAENVQLHDMDGDGDLDITAESWTGGNYSTIVWFKNDGQGNFTQQILMPYAINNGKPYYVDIDNDGDVDHVALAYNLHIRKNDGSGVFSSPQTMPLGLNASYPVQLLFEDMDNDGMIDVVAINGPNSRYFKGTGNGTFAAAVIINGLVEGEYALEDLDGDGDRDLIYFNYLSSTMGWYKNLDGLSFGPKYAISTTAQTIRGLKVYDVDADGHSDIIISSEGSYPVGWHKNDGSENFSIFNPISGITGLGGTLDIADINADGKMDVIASVGWYENLGPFTNTVAGTVRHDIDANGCTDDDTGVPQMLVTMQSAGNTWSAFTNPDGNYSMIAGQGSYNTSVTTTLPNFTVTPQSQQSVFINNSGETSTTNFCLQAMQQITDFEVNIYRIADVRPGFPAQYRVVVKNIGTVQTAGSVTVNFDSAKVNFNSALPAATSQAGGALTFDLGTMLPFAVKEFTLNFTAKTIPTINLGDEVVLTASATVAGDATPGNNTATNIAIVVGSYDPNDIAVREGSQILIEDADEYLHYLIRFQNTGNYYAERVVVKNPLDSKLDWTTMQIEGMSHTGRAEIINGTEATFTFDAIYLPAMTVNEPASHGYIAYKIKPKANVALGDTFTEQAHIYFDFNPAIDTNIVTTTIVDNVNGVPQFTAETVSVYPVPSKAVLNVKANSDIAKIEIYNQAGQCVLANTMQNSIDISALSHGIYFAKIENVHGSSVTKKVVKN